MRKLIILGALLFCITITAQTTYVPDDNFEAYLEANGMGNGVANDNLVTTANINSVTDLNVSSQNIADLTGIEGFVALTLLGCHNNQLTNLDISQNTALIDLYCYNNNLTSLDVSNNTSLSSLFCRNNNLTSLNVSQNTNLHFLLCEFNNLTSLNITQNTVLTQLICNDNQLTSLNVKNGNNSNFLDFNAENNPNLTCINVDNAAWSTAYWTKIDPIVSFNEDCYKTYVPDNNFEALLEDSGFGNGVMDNYVPTNSIDGISLLNIPNKGIADLTGIEDFSSLVILYVHNNNITNLDISANTSITDLRCYNNNLTSLNISANTALTTLYCYDNSLTSIDLSNNTSLEVFRISRNNLTSLDVSNNSSLIELKCGENSITSLDLSQNLNLVQLECDTNQLTNLDIKNGNNTNITLFDARFNPNLSCINVDDFVYSTANWTNKDPASSFNENCFEFLNTYIPDDNFEAYLEANGMGNGIANDNHVLTTNINTITNINIPSKNIADLTGIEEFTALSVLICNQNQITSLDLSQNTALTLLICDENQLTSLNVKNGNNSNIIFFEARSNPNLSCINVDNAAYSTGNWTLRDPTASFSEDCFQFLNTYVPDDNFEAYLEANGMGNGIANDDYVTTSNIETVVNLFIDAQNIADLTGIEDFTALEQLMCSNNQLTSLDLSQNTNLILIICRNINQITSIDVKNGNNTSIVFFDIRGNQNLRCINVDDVIYSTANWTNIEYPSAFSEDCGIKIWESAAWTFGPPTILNDVIIRDDYNTNIQGANIEVNTLIIDSGFTVTIADGGFLNSFGNITVNGNLIVEHQGSVIQQNNNATTINNGNITVRKTTPSLSIQDFMIMASPMTLETREGVYGAGRNVLRHITNNFVPNPDVELLAPGAANWADDNGDNWAVHTGIVNPGEGYFVRPQPTSTSSGIYDLDYTLGTLNNGIINFGVLFNGTQNSSPNIMGNPYASAIDGDLFLAANSMINELYFWEHLTPPSNSYPGYQSNNFNMGDISVYVPGVGGSAADNGGVIPTQWIASGQGFGIKATAAGTAIFNNAMRVTEPNNNYRNNNNEIDRFWLDISNDTYKLGSNMLVAFTEYASDNFDNYDARRFASAVSLYSIVDTGEELKVQGRSSFDKEQKIHLGYVTMVEELQTYTISIREIEGVFTSNATVYLEDRYLNTSTNLSEEDYSFTSIQGNYNDRFVIVFQEQDILGISDSILETLTVYPNPANNLIYLNNPKRIRLIDLSIYDITGRLIKNVPLIGMETEKIINIQDLEGASYILVINGEEGMVTKQLIKK